MLEVGDERLVDGDEELSGCGLEEEGLEEDSELMPQLARVQIPHLREHLQQLRLGFSLRLQEVEDRLRLRVHHLGRGSGEHQ